MSGPGAWVDGSNIALLTDLYELTMIEAYLAEGLDEEAVFSLFVRRLPQRRNYLAACGLDDALSLLEGLRFSEDALAYLRSLKLFSERLLAWLRDFRFTGDVHAIPGGTPVFAGEPIMEVVAPLPQAQLVETALMNQVHVQTVAASKAARRHLRHPRRRARRRGAGGELGSAFQVRAIRLDSGDLLELSRSARRILDDAGLGHVEIFASGGLDEDAIARLLREGAPITGFGVGTAMGVSEDAPSLDVAYKLVSAPVHPGRMSGREGGRACPGSRSWA